MSVQRTLARWYTKPVFTLPHELEFDLTQTFSRLTGRIAHLGVRYDNARRTDRHSVAPSDQLRKVDHQYFDMRIKGPQPDRVLTIGKPEAGGCPVGGRANSAQGWVVPVQYATRSGSLTGKKAGIEVKAKEHYFWLRQDTIYDVTQRMELCP